MGQAYPTHDLGNSNQCFVFRPIVMKHCLCLNYNKTIIATRLDFCLPTIGISVKSCNICHKSPLPEEISLIPLPYQLVAMSCLLWSNTARHRYKGAERTVRVVCSRQLPRIVV
jgi:hypothetical protein